MRILICSDGTDPADNPTRLGGLIAGPCHSPTTLLGIVENPTQEAALRTALETEANMLRQKEVSPEIVVRAGLDLVDREAEIVLSAGWLTQPGQSPNLNECL